MGANLRKNVMRRRARLLREKQAVSPVVATLILILVAVAAAAALYLWLVAWQGGVTGSIGSPHAQYTVTIGGSTSVFPFSEVAIAQFEANNSNIVVSDNQGGTGAGMLAVCHGSVDIGASSSLQTVSGLQTNDQCPSTTVITTVAYDAVDIAVPVANVHQLGSISFDTLAVIYGDASAKAGSNPTLIPTTYNGVTTASGILFVAPFTGAAVGGIAWDQVPACVNLAPTCMGVTGAGNVPIALATSVGPSATTCPGNAALICETAGASPCGFSVCAGGSVAFPGSDLVKTVARSDASGTTQTFEARLLGATSSNAFAASVPALGFGGCGSNNLIADCGMVATQTGNGNPGVISSVSGSPDSLGYASDGLIKASGSGVSAIAFNGPSQTCASGTGCSNGAVSPTTGATGTISAGIKSSATVANYAGWRPFEYVTTNTPTGEVQRYIQYVMDPANNINFASESFEVSIYSV
jgi:flagellin-like protein